MPPPPYSIPWQLRPAGVASVIRSDTALAWYQGADGTGGFTAASMFLVSYKVAPRWAPLLRFGVVHNAPPSGGTAAAAFVNPAVGVTFALPLPENLRLALFLGLALPVGMGGGDAPAAAVAAAAKSGVLARSAMDNAMFAVNDLTVFPGAGLAFVRGGFTAQVELTVLQLIRVRGEAVQPDALKTNLTGGVHLGYFIVPALSVGVDLRFQRWLSTPSFVESDPTTRETLTVAAGARGHFRLGEVWLRPGLAYARGLDDPMGARGFHIVQVDIVVAL